MIFLYILLGIAAIITLALAARIRLNIVYKSGEDTELRLTLRYLFISYQLAPEHKKKVRLRDYTYKKTHGAKKKKKKAKDKSDKPASGKKSSKDTLSVIREVADILKKSQEHLKQSLKIDISRIIIIVGASDAAKTAITYGVVSQAVAYLLEGIDSITNVRRRFRSEVNVIPDFTQREMKVDIKLQLSLTMWALLTIAPRIALASIFKKNSDEIDAL